MRYEVWSRPVSHIYSTSIVSRATVFHVLITALTLIPPLLIAYRSQGFWMREASYREQPDMHFQHELLLVAETRAGRQLGWATFGAVNTFLEDGVRIPTISSREEDGNRDGLLDRLDLELRMPLQPGEEVVSVTLLLVLHARLTRFSVVTMSGLVQLQASGWPGAGVNIVGDVDIVQRQPLAHRGRDDRFTAPPIPYDSEDPEDFLISKILQDYAERNVSLRLSNSYSSWVAGPGARTFTITARLHYPEQTLTYVPGFWQLIKWGWVQYVSILLVFMYISSGVKDYVFSQQILPTIVSRTDK